MARRLGADASRVGYDVDTRPGQWVADQAARRGRAVWTAFALFFLLVGVVAALAVGQRLSVGASLLLAALVLAARPHAVRYVDDAIRWRHGAAAEAAVGATLNELRRERWILMHDVPQAGEGNVDHIAAGLQGAYLIETKLRRYRPADLRKARRQAAKLHDELGVWVTPVICLHERDGEPFVAEKVAIVPHRHLVDWLRAQRNRPVAFERLAAFADRIGEARDWRPAVGRRRRRLCIAGRFYERRRRGGGPSTGR